MITPAYIIFPERQEWQVVRDFINENIFPIELQSSIIEDCHKGYLSVKYNILSLKDGKYYTLYLQEPAYDKLDYIDYEVNIYESEAYTETVTLFKSVNATETTTIREVK